MSTVIAGGRKGRQHADSRLRPLSPCKMEACDLYIQCQGQVMRILLAGDSKGGQHAEGTSPGHCHHVPECRSKFPWVPMHFEIL